MSRLHERTPLMVGVARAGDAVHDTDLLTDDNTTPATDHIMLRRKLRCSNVVLAVGLVVATLAMFLMVISVMMPKATQATEAIVRQTENAITNLADSKRHEYEREPLEAVFVLGGPGAGKGTQCENIHRYFKWSHLSVGDLLREEVQRGGPMAKEINDAMTNGKLVPGLLTVELLKKEMAKQAHDAGVYRFLIDGFPRNRENLDDWESVMGPVDPANQTVTHNASVITHTTKGHHKVIQPFAVVRFALFFDLDEKTMMQRCLHRGETSGRPDDNEGSIKKRFVTYNEETKPILDELERMDLVVTISSVPDEDNVFHKVSKLFEGTERRTPLPPPVSTPGPVVHTNDTTAHDYGDPHAPHHSQPTMTLFNAWAEQHTDIMHHRIRYGCPNI